MIMHWYHVLPIVAIETAIVDPVDTNAWEPKAWGTAGLTASGEFLADFSADFIAAGVEIDDLIYITNSNLNVRAATTVLAVNDTYLLGIPQTGIPDLTDCIYKVGKKQQHTLNTLEAIITARGLASHFQLYGTLWTSAPFNAFRRNQYGDVYCIF